ncbi:MAG: hypothetical protein R3C59_31050 [Planctomycetaceae bacterium]
MFRGRFVLLVLMTTCFPMVAVGEDFPDIRTVEADLHLPELSTESPAPGRRVKHQLAAWQQTSVYHVLYLPQNWTTESTGFPVIVEWAGNGGYSNSYGDISTGRPEGSNLGYGLSAGQDFLWLCLPYLNAAGDDLALKWWGDPPTFDPEPTLRYCREAVTTICREFHGDADRVVLCGFSRGAIACNYLGLHNDAISDLWCGFLAYSHYDGVRRWSFPQSDRDAAALRLRRLNGRPVFICSENTGIESVREYLTSLTPLMPQTSITYTSTGFRNHNDAWILRPSAARTASRQWLRTTIASGADE